MWFCLGPCHSGPRDTSAFVKVCHSKFALYGDANEPFRRGLKIVKAILTATRDIFSKETYENVLN